MKMIATLTSLGLTLTLSLAAYACPDENGKESGQCPLHNYSHALQLEGETAEKVDAVQAEFKAKQKALKDSMHGQMMALKAERDIALKALLTPEQMEQVYQMSKDHHGGHKGHHGMKSDGAKQCPHKKH